MAIEKSNNFYDVIIVGGGAAGLFCGATLNLKDLGKKGLIIEKTSSLGNKLLMSGGGTCNITNGNDIKTFVNSYGKNGGKIRGCLFKHSNIKLMEFLLKKGIELKEREDKKIFPKSLMAKEIRDVLLMETEKNGFTILKNTPVEIIDVNPFLVNKKYQCNNLVVATGGITYPTTGSSGELFELLREKGIEIVEPKEALIPITILEDTFKELKGVSLKNISGQVLESNLKIISKKEGDLLFTGENLSGPLILNLSRYMEKDKKLKLKFGKKIDTIGVNKNILTYVTNETKLPKRLVEALLKHLNIDCSEKASAVSNKRLLPFKEGFIFTVGKRENNKKGMVTMGGVSLEELDLRTFMLKKYENLYLIGEAVDIDGDTGGYNLQFAFSSGSAASISIYEREKL